ncbi:MAG: hypothetical protein QN168_01205 [Armatimonadota bacterium]|nr:hypothetical protein [Armatimonadota bacterium]
MSLGLVEILIVVVIAVIMLARWRGATRGKEHTIHAARALAMGGRVTEPFREGEVARYAGATDGVEWTLRVVSVDDAETPRRTTLIWTTDSVRSEHVLAIVGNDIKTSESAWGWLAGSGYRLDVDPTAGVTPGSWPVAAGQRTAVRLPPVIAFARTAREVTTAVGRLPEGYRVFADDARVALEIVSDEVIAVIKRWHANQGGSLRVWAGGPNLRLLASEINLPSPEGFRDLHDLGMRLTRQTQAVLQRGRS